MKSAIALAALAVAAQLACVRLAGASTPAPAPSATPMATLELRDEVDGVSGGRGTWQTADLTYVRRSAPRAAVYAGLETDRRFGTADVSYLAGLYIPSSVDTILNVEGSFSPTHVMDPARGLRVELDHRLAGGWGYALGYGTRAYAASAVGTETVSVDRYWSHYRFQVALTAAHQSAVSGTSLGQSALLARYYGDDDRSDVSLALQTGREIDAVGRGVVASTVFGATLGGVAWTAHGYAWTWSLSTFRFGTSYTRTGAALGVRARL